MSLNIFLCFRTEKQQYILNSLESLYIMLFFLSNNKEIILQEKKRDKTSLNFICICMSVSMIFFHISEFEHDLTGSCLSIQGYIKEITTTTKKKIIII